MTEIIIDLENINPIEFFGVNNNKFNLIKKRFPLLKILSRGSKVKLSGQPDEILKAQEKINLLLKYLESHGSLSVINFEQILGDEEDNAKEENKKHSDLLEIGNILVIGANGKAIKAKTANQRKMVQLSNENDILFAAGPAGTGKTYTAVGLAVRALKNKIVRKIILTRPAVEAGENLGFLPGDLKEKIDPYLRPLYDALDDMIPTDKLNYFMTNRIIEIAPLAYMRGRTLDNAFIILDEAQNATDLQMKMFLTRIGASAKAIITGDLSQVDLPKYQKSGLGKAINILKDIPGIGHIYLDGTDVLRHRLVKEVIKAYDDEQEKEDIREEKDRDRRRAQTKVPKTENTVKESKSN